MHARQCLLWSLSRYVPVSRDQQVVHAARSSLNRIACRQFKKIARLTRYDEQETGIVAQSVLKKQRLVVKNALLNIAQRQRCRSGQCRPRRALSADGALKLIVVVSQRIHLTNRFLS